VPFVTYSIEPACGSQDGEREAVLWILNLPASIIPVGCEQEKFCIYFRRTAATCIVKKILLWKNPYLLCLGYDANVCIVLGRRRRRKKKERKRKEHFMGIFSRRISIEESEARYPRARK